MEADSQFILKCPTEVEPFAKANIYDYVVTEWKQHPDDLALVNTADDSRLTYAELGAVIENLSRGMAQAGVSRGSSISIWCANCIEIPIVAMAAWRLEAVISLIGPSLTTEEAKRQIVKVKTSFLFADNSHATTAQNSMFESGAVQLALSLHDCKLLRLTGQYPVDKYGIHGTEKFDADNDTAGIMFSSGTTGFPKAVQLTHSNLICQLHLTGYKVTERLMPPAIHFLPLSHFYGFMLIIRSFCDCTVVYVMPRFSIQEYIRLIAKYQIPVLFLVPPVAVMLTKRPDLVKKYDLSCVMALFSAAAPLAPEVEKELAALLPGLLWARARQSYGMTETSGSITRTSTNVGDTEPSGSVGLILPFMEAKIVDEKTGAALGPNKSGELAVRGPLIMKGYYGDPEATKGIFDKNGWLLTGDIAYYDENGFLFIVDRAKELIKYKGMQVAPAELENVLLAHPDVDDVAVVGLPDKLAGELPLAFVVRRPNSDVTEKEIQKYVAERVATYKQLTGGVRFTDVIPKLPTGKILRRLLRDSLRNSTAPQHKL